MLWLTKRIRGSRGGHLMSTGKNDVFITTKFLYFHRHISFPSLASLLFFRRGRFSLIRNLRMYIFCNLSFVQSLRVPALVASWHSIIRLIIAYSSGRKGITFLFPTSFPSRLHPPCLQPNMHKWRDYGLEHPRRSSTSFKTMDLKISNPSLESSPISIENVGLWLCCKIQKEMNSGKW